jgi:choloylglycine hydrolase
MCTNLTVLTGPNNLRLMSARTMDFGMEFTTMVELVPRGQSFPALPPLHHPLLWQNTCGFIGMAGTFTAESAGEGAAVGANVGLSLTAKVYSDGLNEYGLSAAALWLPGSQYPAVGSSGNPAIYNIDFVSWALGTCKTVADVKSALNGITVIDIANLDASIHSPLHFAVSDATGAHAIIEFMNGTMQVYDSATGVMTNAPSYDWHLTNLSNYVDLSIENNAQQWWGQEINGSGMIGLPGDPTPPSRFVRAWMLQQSSYVAGDVQQLVGLALQTLQNLIVPYGVIMENGSTSGPDADHTQWAVVRDHKNFVLYFFTAFNNNLFSINLADIDFATAKAGSVPVVQPTWFTDLTGTITAPAPAAEPVSTSV